MATMVETANEPTVDPDAQATVTDFLDYTEYLPADLIRCLTLLRGLDETFLKKAHAVHQQTREYGALPKLPVASRPDAQKLRAATSTQLDQALSAREASYAEAIRLFDMADRHYNRLSSIVNKLHALPKPPSRDSTPAASSPEAKRSRSGRKVDDGMSTPRLTLNPPRVPAIPAHLMSSTRNRRTTGSGELVPHLNPDSPIASTEQSDWESDTASPSRIDPEVPHKKPTFAQPKKPKTPKPPRTPHDSVAPSKMPTPPPEDSQIGGEHRPWVRLTEWEMWKLRKKMKKNITWEPSEIMIQRELSEKGRGWDNYYKASAEAVTKGEEMTDVDQLDKALEKGETGGQGEMSMGDAAAIRNRGMKLNEAKKLKRETLAREQAATAAAEAEAAARRLGDIGSAFKNLFSPPGSVMTGLNDSNSSSIANDASVIEKRTSKKRKADQLSTTLSPPPPPPPEPGVAQKKARVDTETKTGTSHGDGETTEMPLNISLPAATSSTLSSLSTSNSPTGQTGSTRLTSIDPKGEPAPPLLSRPPSRSSRRRSTGFFNSADTGKKVSSDSNDGNGTATATTILPSRSGRRTSTPGLKSAESTATKLSQHFMAINTPTAASSRPKREAPGTITQSSADGGAAVSISKRKNKPNPKTKPSQSTPPNTTNTTTTTATTTVTATAASAASPTENPTPISPGSPTPQIRIDIDGKSELIDPDEERFCICADVSWGEMICCEMDDRCEDGQWFHLGCVDLVELPARTVKWYSPACRKKWRKGVESAGCVGRGLK